MATNTRLKLKKSSVVGRVPAPGDLEYGEIAINYADGKLYYKNSSNAVKAFGDSDNIISLITNFSVDSSEVINLIDSDYIQARSAATLGSSNTVILNSYNGDSSTTLFTLSTTPATEHHSFVTINGIQQHVDAYSIAGSNLTLSEAPTSIDKVEVRTIKTQNADVELRDYTTFTYQPSSATTTFTGADVSSRTLAYTIGKLDVFFNGSRLINGLDYTASNGSSIVLLGDAASSGDTISINSFGSANIIDGKNTAALTTTASNQPVDSFLKSVYRSAKYIVQMTQNSRYHSQEVLLIHNGTTVSMVEYADIYTESDLGSLDADISGSAVRLLVSPTYTNTNVTISRVSLGV